MTPNSSPSPGSSNPGNTPPFLDDLGNQLTSGRAALVRRRRSTNVLAGLGLCALLAGGGVFALAQLSNDSPATDIAGGPTDTTMPARNEGTANVDPGPPTPGPDTTAGAIDSDIERYRCAAEPAVVGSVGRPSLDGPASSNPEIADIQQMRANVGLPSDEASTVSAMENDVASSGDTFSQDMRAALGFPLTAEELRLVTGSDNPNHQSSADAVLDDDALRAELEAYLAVHEDTYAGRWIDRSRLGRPMAVAFVQDLSDIEQRQAELDDRFGDGRFIATQAEVSLDELDAMVDRINAIERDGQLAPWGVGTLWREGQVRVDLEVFDAASVLPIVEAVGTEHWCATGADPSEVRPDGPHTEAGEGWRLLFTGDVGNVYATWVAFEQSQYELLMERLDPSAEVPEVDFTNEVVVWFGSVYSSGCEDERLEDVVIGDEAGLVYTNTQLPGGNRGCDGDARPRAFVVAIERDQLPATPFTVQLDADGPPGCCEDTELFDVTQAMLDGFEEGPSLNPRLPDRAPSTGDEFAQELQIIIERIIGLSEEEALDIILSTGLDGRLVAVDGVLFDREDDLRDDRLNLVVTNGVVTQAFSDNQLGEFDATFIGGGSDNGETDLGEATEAELRELFRDALAVSDEGNVTVLIYSGRPNPSVRIPRGTLDEVLTLIEALDWTSAETDVVFDGGLGFTGLQVDGLTTVELIATPDAVHLGLSPSVRIPDPTGSVLRTVGLKIVPLLSDSAAADEIQAAIAGLSTDNEASGPTEFDSLSAQFWRFVDSLVGMTEIEAVDAVQTSKFSDGTNGFTTTVLRWTGSAIVPDGIVDPEQLSTQIFLWVDNGLVVEADRAEGFNSRGGAGQVSDD